MTTEHVPYTEYLPKKDTLKRMPFGNFYVDMEMSGASAIDIANVTKSIRGVRPSEVFVILSSIIRYTGHLGRDADVLTHSIRVSDISREIGKAEGLDPSEAAFYGLIHDMQEVITGDITRPVKNAVPGLLYLDSICELAFREVFSIPNPSEKMREVVAAADHRDFQVEYTGYFGGKALDIKTVCDRFTTDPVDAACIIWDNYYSKSRDTNPDLCNFYGESK